MRNGLNFLSFSELRSLPHVCKLINSKQAIDPNNLNPRSIINKNLCPFCWILDYWLELELILIKSRAIRYTSSTTAKALKHFGFPIAALRSLCPIIANHCKWLREFWINLNIW